VPYAVKLLQGEPGTWSIVVKESDLANLHPSNAALLTQVTVDGVEHTRLDPATIDDLWIVCRYVVTS